MKILFSCFLMIAAIMAQQTPLEKCNYSKLTSQKELSQYIKEADSKSDLIKSEVIAKSVSGLEIYAVYFSKSGIRQRTNQK